MKKHLYIKFRPSKNSTKFEKIFHLRFDATDNFKLNVEDFFKFCALLMTPKLYRTIQKMWVVTFIRPVRKIGT